MLAAFLVAGGCTPNLPFHLAETAEVLHRGEAQVTAAAGTGGVVSGDSSFCNCGGAGLRVRLGLGHRQEIGVEGSLIIASDGSFPHAAEKVSWKLGLADWVAVVAGAGVGRSPDGAGADSAPVYGFDLALVASTSPARGFAFYGGVRGSVDLPFKSDLRAGPGAGVNAIFPFGIAVGGGSPYRLYFEMGVIRRWSYGNDPGFGHDPSFVAMYGAVGFGYRFGRVAGR